MINTHRIFEFFNEICSIPHKSGHTNEIREYLVNFAKRNSLDYVVDKGGNVVIKKSGNNEKEPVILQAHMDMVAVSVDKNLDMTKAKIETYIENGYLRAKGTSLGADDGIGMAYILAILEENNSLFPPLEVLFTVDEETGMDGAVNLEMNNLKGNRIINLDSEDEGELLSSSAGGAHFTEYYSVEKDEMDGQVIQVEINGLYGGHSGQEIARCGANAIKELLNLLNILNNTTDSRVLSIEGGDALNIIPKNALGTIVSNNTEAIDRAIDSFNKELKELYKSTDPNARATFKILSDKKIKHTVINQQSFKNFICSIDGLKHGVIEYAKDDKDFVTLSENYGKIKYAKDDEQISLYISIRSNDDDRKKEYLNEIENKFKNNTSLKYVIDSIYPAWKYQPSDLRKIMKKVYKEMYGKDMLEKKIHAGLECGYFIEKRPSIDATSIGPNVKNVHTTDEMLDIESAKRVYEYLCKVLEAL